MEVRVGGRAEAEKAVAREEAMAEAEKAVAKVVAKVVEKEEEGWEGVMGEEMEEEGKVAAMVEVVKAGSNRRHRWRCSSWRHCCKTSWAGLRRTYCRLNTNHSPGLGYMWSHQSWPHKSGSTDLGPRTARRSWWL